MQSLVYYYIINIQALQVLARLRGEYELEELYQDSEASVCARTGDKKEHEYLPKGLWIASENGLRLAIRGTL